jgi:hypothetical protein
MVQEQRLLLQFRSVYILCGNVSVIVMEHEATDAAMLILYLTSHGHGDIAYAGMESSICKMD